MTATNHALTGAVVALAIKQPILAIPLALASHFVIDMIPHFDAGLGRSAIAKIVVAIDCLLAGSLTVLLSIFFHTDISGWLLFACMAIAMSPDLVWGWRYYKLRDFKKIISEPMSLFSRYHQKIQWSETPKGILVEIPWLITMAVLINTLRQ